MAAEKVSYHYEYGSLDALLQGDYDALEIGNQLDAIMSELVEYASKEQQYSEILVARHHLLRELRNIFWKLTQES